MLDFGEGDLELPEFVGAQIGRHCAGDTLHRVRTANQGRRYMLGNRFKKLSGQQPCISLLIDRDPIQATGAQYDLLIKQSTDSQADMNQA